MQTIYIGANKHKLNLHRNRVYYGNPETLINGLKEKIPLIGQLFVPVKEIDSALSEMRTKGTAKYIAARQVETA